MIISKDIASIFRRALGTFDVYFAQAYCEDRYMYATDGKLLLLYKLSEEEFLSAAHHGQPRMLTYQCFKSMTVEKGKATVLQYAYEDGFSRWYQPLDSVLNSTLPGKEKLMQAAASAIPVCFHQISWKHLALLGEPADWMACSLPWNNHQPMVLLFRIKQPYMLAVVTPYNTPATADLTIAAKKMFSE